jgi:ABC-type glutathione transport system ATPase component
VSAALQAPAAAERVLAVEGLRIEADGHVLVEGLSFRVAAGQVLGIVGESGSGKSMTAFAIAGLLPAGVRVAGGRVTLGQHSLLDADPATRRELAGGEIGIVFQDPLSSFNPVRTIGSILIESARRHRRCGADEARRIAIDALRDVRLPRPEAIVDAYPHQLSGGQRQRAMIALALLNDPLLLIADEPTTALDATVQLQILALLKRGAGDRALILITHDLAVAASVCDHLLVMQNGRCVEAGTADRVLGAPEHPYTRALLAAVRSLAGTAT